jgi:hypothetical protein
MVEAQVRQGLINNLRLRQEDPSHMRSIFASTRIRQTTTNEIMKIARTTLLVVLGVRLCRGHGHVRDLAESSGKCGTPEPQKADSFAQQRALSIYKSRRVAAS